MPYFGYLELEIKKGKKEYYMFTYNEVFTAEPKVNFIIYKHEFYNRILLKHSKNFA